MRPALALVLAVALLPLAAGCLTGDPAPQAAPAGLEESGGANATAADPGWPPLEGATIRPGVAVVGAFPVAGARETGDCTANFLFRSPDNASLYLGTAAHCVAGLQNGTPILIGGGFATGTLVYDSYAMMEEVGEEDADASTWNDFALVRIDDEYRGLAHPAVRHWGGPVGLANASEVAPGDAVLMYGNSMFRMGVEPVRHVTGEVLSQPNPWLTSIRTAPPAVWGDSGSGVMTADGRALAVLKNIQPFPEDVVQNAWVANGVVSLDLALAYMMAHGGPTVELVTWPLLTTSPVAG